MKLLTHLTIATTAVLVTGGFPQATQAKELFLLPKTTLAPEIDTLDENICGAISAWQRYLAATAEGDTAAMSQWWNPAEKKRYTQWDFARDLIRPAGNKELILERAQQITRLTPAGHYYEAEIHWGNDEAVEIKHLIRTTGDWSIADPLTQIVVNWKHQRFVGVDFIFPPDHEFAYPKATKTQRLLDSLTEVFAIPPIRNVVYYACDNSDQFLRLQGLLKYPGILESRTLLMDRIIFSAVGGESNRREAVMIVIGEVGNPLPFVRRGVATYYGGSARNSPEELIKKYVDFCSTDHNPKFGDLIRREPQFVEDERANRDLYDGAGALFIDWIDHKLGTDIVYQMMYLASDEEQLDRLLSGFAKVSLNDFDDKWSRIVEGWK